jgi:hypothetical protein
MLPQLGVVSTRASSISTCANRTRDPRLALRERDTSPTLLVSGSAPPRPSIWRLSGEPIAASNTLVAQCGILWQVRFEKKGSARRAAAHEETRDGGLHFLLSDGETELCL